MLLVSDAKDDGNSIIVTKSDEAFGLLLIDNYLEKWKTTLASEEETTSVEPVNNSNTTEGEVTGGQKKKEKAKRLPGKYTEKKKTGTCKFSGWSRAGMARFNQLYSLVEEDRASAQSEEMERELLTFCRAKAGMNAGDEQQEGGVSDNNVLEMEEAMVATIEAAWDSDDD